MAVLLRIILLVVFFIFFYLNNGLSFAPLPIFQIITVILLFIASFIPIKKLKGKGPRLSKNKEMHDPLNPGPVITERSTDQEPGVKDEGKRLQDRYALENDTRGTLYVVQLEGEESSDGNNSASQDEATDINSEERKIRNFPEEASALYKLCQEIIVLVPILQKLKAVLEDALVKRQNLNTNYSKAIEEKLDQWRNLSEPITQFFRKNEAALNQRALEIHKQTDDFDMNKKEFSNLRDAMHGDLGAIEKTKSISNELGSNMLDMVEKIHILAINTAIEAARIGESGKGFSVIAGELQKLSSEATQVVENLVDKMGKSMESLKSEITERRNSIDQVMEDILSLLGDVKSISDDIQSDISHSEIDLDSFDQLLTDAQLNSQNLRVGLEKNTAVDTVLEHIFVILDEYQKQLKDFIEPLSQERGEDLELIQEKLIEQIKFLFTIKEEYVALGLPVNSDT